MMKKLPWLLSLAIVWIACSCSVSISPLRKEILELERDRVLIAADEYLSADIQTITEVTSSRSAGGPHDFYSEGDYWWPDPENSGGPYIRKDGLTNPDNFVEHRNRMRRLSIIVPTLVAAWTITHNDKYALKAIEHTNAWFVNEDTRMNPDMLYSQAIFGRVTGRGIGIIDAIHLVEVVQALMVLEENSLLTGKSLEKTKDWFTQFNTWITTHPYGIEERDNGNNHSTCWAMQVAQYAVFTGNDSLLFATKGFYDQTLLPEQMAANGSFPKELARTKPYGYSLFNLDATYTLLHILGKSYPQVWQYQVGDSLQVRKAVDFMAPYIADKATWPYAPDVMYFDDWPMRQSALLFSYIAYGDDKYLELWKTLPADSEEDEVIRNFFIRQPLLWVKE
ncbi:alginate lyase family protein [uncultured Imperialibacter sp.]|uniref:alginate lyase family protein n=1 Tax=uncultured Imperialibacter sp. TaxID=1672639 RepID=UPI0030DCCDA6|tara:strand:+ start:5052 stop:6230 length:1179 start_codon:yes stop_codon:yes gene_type:complete